MPSRLQAAAVAILIVGAAPAAIEEGLRRLRALPPQRRAALVANLERFDALPAGERAALRRLDDELAALSPDVRRRYLSLLHRYALWVQTLDPERQQELRQASPERRLALIEAYRQAGVGPGAPRRCRDRSSWPPCCRCRRRSWPTVSRSGSRSIPRSGRRWRSSTRSRRNIRLGTLGRARGIRREFFDDLPPQFREEMEEFRKRLGTLSRADIARAKAQRKVDRARMLAEARFLQVFEPRPIDRDRLARFEAATPDWLLAPLDPLPPELAHRMLQILYTMITPPGEELELPEPPPPPATAPVPPLPPGGVAPGVSPF